MNRTEKIKFIKDLAVNGVPPINLTPFHYFIKKNGLYYWESDTNFQNPMKNLPTGGNPIPINVLYDLDMKEEYERNVLKIR